ncbi:MAG: diaminopimelate epimerase [Bacteroidota bacterium]|jgi:diaminopimelate epimerase
MKFTKYHALGNDYIVLDLKDCPQKPTQSKIKLLCNRNFGIGSDGILWGPLNISKCDFALRIFNPDGSEAEKSGNGLRIFSRYLYDNKLVGKKPFTILTKGGEVVSQVISKNRVIIDMGRVSFDSNQIPVLGKRRDVINETIKVNGKNFKFCAVTIGNPHCVLVCRDISEEEAKKYGPIIEIDKRFPKKINVQFMKVLNRRNIRIEIWERGAGYTLASGSSSSAAAAVAYKLGLCDSNILVNMPGGKIEVVLSKDFKVTMTGSVTKVFEGVVDPETL